MSNPSGSDVHVDRPLNNVAIAFLQKVENYLFRAMFSEVPVEDKTGKFLTIPKGAWLRDGMKERAPGTEAEDVDFEANFDSTYACRRFDAKAKIPDEYRDNQTSPFNYDKAKTEFLTQQALTKQERLWVSRFFTTGVWANDVTPSTLWSDASSDLFADMATAQRAILLATGRMPNKFGVSYDVHTQLKKHPDIIDRVKYVAGESFKLAIAPGAEVEKVLAEIFEVQKYVVGRSVYNSAAEGIATPVMAFNAGKDALLAYAPDTASLLEPSAGYQFRWKKFAGNAEGIRIKKYREEKIESDIIESAFSKDFKVCSSDCGYFFSGAVA